MFKNLNLKKLFSNNMFLLKIALKESRMPTIMSLIGGIQHNVIVFIEHVYMIAYIVDSIQYKKPFLNVAIFVISVFVSLVILRFLEEYVDSRTRPKGNERINRRIRMMLYEKAQSMDLECYDNPDFYNDFIWSMNNANERIHGVIDSTSRFLGAIVGILVAGGYIFTQSRLCLLLVLISFILITVSGSKFRKLSFNLENRLNPIIRKRDYINRVFYLGDYSKEIRLSNVKDKLLKDFNETELLIQKEYKKSTRKLAFYNFLTDYVCNTFIFDFVYIIYLIYITLVKKLIGYGTLLALYNTAGRLRSSMLEFGEVIPQFKEHSLYIEKIRKFLDYDIKIKSIKNNKELPRETKSIILNNISFSYSEDSKPVLSNIDLKIEADQKIAIVGYNGAGKTTLVKLLMRLYDVSSGAILYDGVNIKDYDVIKYRNNFAALFQDYQIFAATVRENVVVTDSDIDIDKFDEVISKSGFTEKLSALNNGIDTELTKEFSDDGVDLSGGEKQKISISRSLYKDSRIIILDEPSSALDPIAEYNLNNTMLNLERNKTIIFISHRLSTTKMADKIYMFESGRLIEQGTHDELMIQKGKYAEMFNLQSEKYQ